MSRSTLPEGDFTSCERLPSGLITRCTYKCRSRPAPSGRIVGNSYLGDYFRVARQLGMTLRFAEVGSREGDFSAREQGTHSGRFRGVAVVCRPCAYMPYP